MVSADAPSANEDVAIIIDPTSKVEKPGELESNIYHWDKSSRKNWTITFFIGCIFVYSVRTSMSIASTAIGKDLGWNKQISGMALSAFFCGYITTNVIGGYLADRMGGAIIIYYTGLVWGSISICIPFLAHSHHLFRSGTIGVLVARFLTGVSQGVFFPSLTSILTKHISVEERGFAYSFIQSGAAVGTTLTGFIGSIMIDSIGWPSLFYTIGAGTLIWLLWLRSLQVKNKVEIDKDEPDITKPKVKEVVPWFQLAAHSSVWALFVVYFCSNMTFYNLLSWTPAYFHDAFPESKGWVFNVVPWLANFIIANLSGYLSNSLLSSGSSVTFVRKLYAGIQQLGVAVFALLLNSVETFNQALFVMSIIIGLMAFANCSSMINSQDLAPKHAGALHGVMNCCGAIAGFVGVYLTGYMLERTGNWASVWNLQAALSFLGFIVFQVFGSGEKVV